MAFLKLKAFLMKPAACTIDDLWNTIAMDIKTFTPTQCQNHFVASEYERVRSEISLDRYLVV